MLLISSVLLHHRWPTKTTLPGGAPYGYDVGTAGALGRNVVAEFRSACEVAGIKPGWYYSLKVGNDWRWLHDLKSTSNVDDALSLQCAIQCSLQDNFYLNVHSNGQVSHGRLLPGMANVTQSEFDTLALAQLRELWTNNGNVSEAWFDGGVPVAMRPAVRALIEELLPHTVVFDGAGVSLHPVKWVGTESGSIGGPIWSTGVSRQGNPDASEYVPVGCDTVITTPHTWFAISGMGVRSLGSLIDTYHSTVGNNCVLELGFAALRTGLIPDDQAQRAKEFGDWIRTCYAVAVASVAGNGTNVVDLPLPLGSLVDRIVIQEDIALGQRVRAYTVQAKVGRAWRPFSAGTSIGHKRIDVRKPVAASELRLTIDAAAAPPIVARFAAFSPCPKG